jgi:protein-disulfide isomerase
MVTMKLYALALVALVPCLAASMGDFDKDKILGNPAAPVQIEIYSDFECPACKNFHETLLPTIMHDYVVPGKVCVISREFPLNIPDHHFSREAANFATAAARVGKYQAVADALFQNQVSWSESGRLWETIAPVLSPSEQKRVQMLVKDPSVTAEVQRDYDSAMSQRVNQTPTLLIKRGSRQYAFAGPAPGTYLLLRSLIDGLLK